MSPGSSTESYPAFARIGLRENPGKKPQPGNLPRPGFEPGPPGFAARRADRYSTVDATDSRGRHVANMIVGDMDVDNSKRPYIFKVMKSFNNDDAAPIRVSRHLLSDPVMGSKSLCFVYKRELKLKPKDNTWHIKDEPRSRMPSVANVDRVWILEERTKPVVVLLRQMAGLSRKENTASDIENHSPSYVSDCVVRWLWDAALIACDPHSERVG
ncbi:hypothetical protein ANN_01286 [Periplaneta americana]|uniref:Uncharacterized protein n=1 Tax=Periplaneta americana TaxID=6978 RepID=A0ABQ8TX70_PERAM|nr:hypothetical protein ANN_01286 [Periplaneta americana]